ncbi:MAG: RagB/SusD family nutrient uptake outer membrane protein [Bacteroidales bacterium]|jgi:hypothetical protein|nr:RagB/SusD family nutrient uptake outer membrane protein [Bacteroidales bacterium]
MKKYIYGCLIAIISFALPSCSLDENPKSSFSEEDAFSNSTLIYVNSVASLYTAIGSSIYGDADNCVHTLQEFTSDESIIPGRQGDWVDGGKWQNMFMHNFESSVDTYANIWNRLYKVIGLCNSSIDLLTAVKQTNPAAESYIYEVRALRAIYYYYAMDLFAQVPLVISSDESVSDVSQSNRSEVFKFVTEELADCIPHLSTDPSQNNGEYYGRVTKAVAYMYMAKCALNAPVYTIDATSPTSYKAFVGDDLSGECKASETLGAAVSERGKNISMKVDSTSRNAWETVIYCVNKIKSLGYSLEPKYADNFVVTNDNSTENIFTRPDDDKVYKIQDYNLIRSIHYNHAGAMGYSSWNGACATVRQMRIMHYGEQDQDPRLSLNYYTGTDYTEDTGGKLVNDGATSKDLEYLPLAVVLDFPAEADAHDVKCAGARFKKYEFDKSSSIIGDINNDLVIMRYGDAVLMKAEAEYRLGDKGEALIDVNLIRDRAGAGEDKEITLDAILNERAAELAWEGLRRQDQIRFCTFTQPTADRYTGVKHNASAGNYNNDTQGYTMVFPIPYSIINLNKNMTQNPGYSK